MFIGKYEFVSWGYRSQYMVKLKDTEDATRHTRELSMYIHPIAENKGIQST